MGDEREGRRGSDEDDDSDDILKSTDEMRSWSDLTHECLVVIISRLSMEDRWRGTMFVCKSWMEATKDPSLFSTFDLERLFVSAAGDTSLWWSPHFERRIDAMLRSAALCSDGQMREIRLRHCSDRSLGLAAERYHL